MALSNCTPAVVRMDHAGHCGQEVSLVSHTKKGDSRVGNPRDSPEGGASTHDTASERASDLHKKLSWRWSRVVTCCIRTWRRFRTWAFSFASTFVQYYCSPNNARLQNGPPPPLLRKLHRNAPSPAPSRITKARAMPHRGPTHSRTPDDALAVFFRGACGHPPSAIPHPISASFPQPTEHPSTSTHPSLQIPISPSDSSRTLRSATRARGARAHPSVSPRLYGRVHAPCV